jgi:conjugal transfer pilus assembly protein TraF
MKSKMPYFLLLILVGLPVKGFAQDFLIDRERGWYWFEEEKMSNTDLPEDKQDRVVQNAFDANKEMEKLQKAIQQALNLAILVPTETNVQNYLSYQIKAFNLSERFTEASKMLQVRNPVLDYQIEAPYNHNARIIKNQEDRKVAEEAVKILALTHGLFFFFDSNCPYCEVMAPNVLSFANKYGMHLIPVSVGGGTLKEFPKAVPDNGIANAYGVTHLPALFAVNPRTQAVLKLANRVTSITELEDVVLRHKLFNKDAGDEN